MGARGLTVCDSFDEVYAVYDERTIKARRPHFCEACDRLIAPGAYYVRVGIVFDGRAWSVRRCGACQKIHEHLRGLGDGEVWPDERLNCGEDYSSVWGVPPPEEMAALAFASDAEASELLRVQK